LNIAGAVLATANYIAPFHLLIYFSGMGEMMKTSVIPWRSWESPYGAKVGQKGFLIF